MDITHFRKLLKISQDIQNVFFHCLSSAVQTSYLFSWSIWNWESMLHPDFKCPSYIMIFLSVLKVMLYLFKWIDMYKCSACAQGTFLISTAEIQHWTRSGIEHRCRGHLVIFGYISTVEKQWKEAVLLHFASYSTCQM